jgi:hypothetical protein
VLQQQNKARESLEPFTRAARFQKPNVGELRSVAMDYVLLDDYDDAVFAEASERALRISNKPSGSGEPVVVRSI